MELYIAVCVTFLIGCVGILAIMIIYRFEVMDKIVEQQLNFITDIVKTMAKYEPKNNIK